MSANMTLLADKVLVTPGQSPRVHTTGFPMGLMDSDIAMLNNECASYKITELRIKTLYVSSVKNSGTSGQT